METTEIVLNTSLLGEIQLFSNGKKAGKMDISIMEGKLTVYHTEIKSEYEGKGFAKLLLTKLVAYARDKNLKIVPLCPFVYAQFKHHPEEYKDIWFNPRD